MRDALWDRIERFLIGLLGAMAMLVGGGFSPECLAVQGLVAKEGVVFVPLNACANEQMTKDQCNKYTFRVFPVGRQLDQPLVAYEVQNFGKKWGIIYPDYVLGQSTVMSTSAALQMNGTDFAVKIAVPLGEANVTPYVTQIPTDGSIDVLTVFARATGAAACRARLQETAAELDRLLFGPRTDPLEQLT